jgi:hypothetical protein
MPDHSKISNNYQGSAFCCATFVFAKKIFPWGFLFLSEAMRLFPAAKSIRSTDEMAC